MLEVGKSYRTVDGRNTGPLKSDWPARFRATEIFIPGSVPRIGQAYNDDGSVFNQRSGEENDRIVGPWVPEITIGGKYRASTGVATVRCVADDHVFYVRQDGTAGTLKVDDFFKHFTFVPPTKTVWVNLWWKNGAYVDTGATHDTEEAARATGNGPEDVYIKTISLEVPA